MKYLLVRHKVADYGQWKRVFDSHTQAHLDHGMRLQKLTRNIEDPNEVVFWFEIDDVERVNQFASSPESAEAAKQAGVADTPDVYFLED